MALVMELCQTCTPLIFYKGGDPARASYARHHTYRRIVCQCQGERAGPYCTRSQDPWRFYSRLLHSPGRPLAGGCGPNREQDGAVAVSFVDWCLRVCRPTGRLATGRVATGVQPLLGENYTYSRILDHVQLWIWHHTVGRSIYIFLPPSSLLFLLD